MLELERAIIETYFRYLKQPHEPDVFFDIIHRESDRYEFEKVAPTYQTLKIFYYKGFLALKPCLAGLERNVAFLTCSLPPSLELFRMGCDWCSLCNGLIHTAVENIQRDPALIWTINVELYDLLQYLESCLQARRHRITQGEVEQWARAQFGTDVARAPTRYLTLARIYLLFEQIELRWCPFKRSKEFYYRNRDRRFVEPTLKNIYQIGQALAREETVTCNNCPGVINRAMPGRHGSIFEPVLAFLLGQLPQNF